MATQENGPEENKVENQVIEITKPRPELTEEMIEEIKTAFEMFDEDGNHSIDCRELKKTMLTLGVEATNEEILELMRTVDKDGNGTIDFQEFMILMADKLQARNKAEDVETAFRLYDEEEKGKITLENLKKVAQEVKLDVDEEELKEMIKVADRNGDGEVTLEDFKRVMRKVGYLPSENA